MIRTARASRGPATGGARTGGFTLLELVVAIAVTSLVMVAVGSTILLAGKGLPDEAGPAPAAAARVADQIAAELYCAASVTQRSATLIEFTVPDRDGDGVNETICYTWSGSPGDALTRQYNGGGPVTVLEDVDQFNLAYQVKTNQTGPSTIEGPEQLFLDQDGSNSGSPADFNIQSDTRCAEYFKPALPSDALSWRITRVRFIASRHAGSSNSSFAVSVQGRSGMGKPDPALVVDTVTVPESDLGNGTWFQVALPSAGGLSPSKGYFVVFTGLSGAGTIAEIRIGANSLGSPQTTFHFDAGTGTWMTDLTKDIWLYVWGKVTRLDPDPPPPTGKLLWVDITLSAGAESSRVRTKALLLSRPELTSGP
jgi:prepilin-type N-terminal cleavage/methylation domain-containing protein